MPELNADLRDITQEDMDYEGRSLLKDGDYRFIITWSEYKQTEARNGMCLHLNLTCVEPGFKTKLRDFLTLEHPNNDTVRIAKAKLKQLAIAVGHPTPDFVQNSDQLHNIPLVAKVGREKSKDPKYGEYQNRILSYKPTSAGNSGQAPAGSNEPPPLTDDDIPF